MQDPVAFGGFSTEADQLSLRLLGPFMTPGRHSSAIDSFSTATYNINPIARLGGGNGRRARPEKSRRFKNDCLGRPSELGQSISQTDQREIDIGVISGDPRYLCPMVIGEL